MTKFLSQILPSIDCKIVTVDGNEIENIDEIDNIPITSLVFDSREVTTDSLFFALQGTHLDGNKFIPSAIKNGANAVIYQDDLSENLQKEIAKVITERTIDNELSNNIHKFAPVLIKVKDSRVAMSPLSDSFYDSPSKRLIVIGVTGTEGKSSTVSFIWQLLKKCGFKAGFISTVEYSFGNEALPNPQHQTTPEAPIIQHHLNKMLENGCSYAVVEASSHGLSAKLNRCGNVIFDCAIFMNVTLEHLEFHKNFENYRNDKANLFRALDKTSHIKVISGEQRKINSIGIVNLEDPSASFFMNATKSNIYGFTTEGKARMAAWEKGEDSIPLPKIPEHTRYMVAHNIASITHGLSFNIDTDGENALFDSDYDSVRPREHFNIDIKSYLPGAFNTYNIMASLIAVSSVTNLSFEQIAKHTTELNPIKGRMTVIEEGQDFEVIVDYAHTPSSFETIFPPLRKRLSGKLFALFGSGGERDLTKRPLQGEMAAKYCDVIVLADEDPRGEDPEKLLRDIAVGAEKMGKIMGENLFIIHERQKAIRAVLKMARKGDIVLFLGKAHENSIIYKDFVMPYDEITEVKTALNELKLTNR